VLAAAAGQGARIEGVTMVLLLTDQDDFNALASTLLLDTVDGGVYRIAPPSHEHGVVAPFAGVGLLFADHLTGPALQQRYGGGARIVVRRVADGIPAGHEVLFVLDPEGRVRPMTVDDPPEPGPADTVLLLTT
jgi:hypothetical protein